MATQTVQQIDCPYPGDTYVTSAQTQEGAAVRFIEHAVHSHPGGLPGPVVSQIQKVLDILKGKYQ